jgi:hypothetical protein
MASCIDNDAYIAAANAQGDYEIKVATSRAVISAGVLAAQIAMRSYISGKQQDIADRQMQIGETLREQAKKFWEIDKALLSETCATPMPKADYSLKETFSNMLGDADCIAKPCKDVNPCFAAEAKNIERKHEVDLANFAMRYAENRKTALEDRRWKRKYKSLQAMRGIYSGADRMFDNAAQMAGSAAANKAAIINGALFAAGVIVASPPQMPTYQGRKEYSWDGTTTTKTDNQVYKVDTVVPATMGAPTGQQHVAMGPYDGRMPKDAELNANSVPVQEDGTTPLNPFWSDANSFANEFAPYRTK